MTPLEAIGFLFDNLDAELRHGGCEAYRHGVCLDCERRQASLQAAHEALSAPAFIAAMHAITRLSEPRPRAQPDQREVPVSPDGPMSPTCLAVEGEGSEEAVCGKTVTHAVTGGADGRVYHACEEHARIIEDAIGPTAKVRQLLN